MTMENNKIVFLRLVSLILCSISQSVLSKCYNEKSMHCPLFYYKNGNSKNVGYYPLVIGYPKVEPAETLKSFAQNFFNKTEHKTQAIFFTPIGKRIIKESDCVIATSEEAQICYNKLDNNVYPGFRRYRFGIHVLPYHFYVMLKIWISHFNKDKPDICYAYIDLYDNDSVQDLWKRIQNHYSDCAFVVDESRLLYDFDINFNANIFGLSSFKSEKNDLKYVTAPEIPFDIFKKEIITRSSIDPKPDFNTDVLWRPIQKTRTMSMSSETSVDTGSHRRMSFTEMFMGSRGMSSDILRRQSSVSSDTSDIEEITSGRPNSIAEEVMRRQRRILQDN